MRLQYTTPPRSTQPCSKIATAERIHKSDLASTNPYNTYENPDALPAPSPIPASSHSALHSSQPTPIPLLRRQALWRRPSFRRPLPSTNKPLIAYRHATQGKAAELVRWIEEHRPASIGEAEFATLRAALAPVSESYLPQARPRIRRASRRHGRRRPPNNLRRPRSQPAGYGRMRTQRRRPPHGKSAAW